MEKIFKGMENGPEAIDSNFNELVDPNRDQTVNDLTVNGQLNVGGNQKVVSDDEQRFGGELNIHIDRVGNECLIKFSGKAQGNNWSNIGPERIKLGFRPINDVVIGFNEGQTAQIGEAKFIQLLLIQRTTHGQNKESK